MDKIIKIVTGFFGVVLLGIGMRWLVDPGGAAGMIEMELLDGAARSSQVGDLAAFFLVAGSFALLGLITRNATLLYAPAALVGVAAFARTLSWLVHDAALVAAIGPEIVMCVVFLLASKRMAAAGE